ncbi:bacteriorhodopsin-like [Aquisalinus flavus]|uniref:Xanthorhodopsin n=1 Tax=Aquisalinus flavus TaxID=1526572 RepID=A0A8J2Y4Y1_9PROT|nr:bacteriorhodopsin-like [Aquisalinus flavus]MBD0427888.1 bacteriorhodopsin [Aquisalinus flavus]UNE47649.1 xanthorhodopsin [Aquisalinus flavus]GGD04646.1 xanthorhodopsin [Aquisalinus flavus]
MEIITSGQYDLIYNAFSFAFATLAAATIFFWLGRSQVAPQYKSAMTITGLVTFIAAYHYFRIFESWGAAYDVSDGVVTTTGYAFNQAYRYVDWFLTVPLLLVELILVMGLSRSETISRALRLGILAALMIALGYPGEVAETVTARWIWGIASMIPFLWIVYELFAGLSKSIASQPEDARGLVKAARYVVVGSWAFYPVVYFAGAVGLDSAAATVIVEVGYTIADITAKAVFGVLIFMIAQRKSASYFESHKAPVEKAAVRPTA